MSASTAGRPLRCQFGGAADIERADLGKTFDPNHDEPATIADLAVTSWRTMGSPRLTALGIGCATIRIPGSPPGRSKTSEKIRSPELRPDIYSDGDRRAMLPSPAGDSAENARVQRIRPVVVRADRRIRAALGQCLLRALGSTSVHEPMAIPPTRFATRSRAVLSYPRRWSA